MGDILEQSIIIPDKIPVVNVDKYDEILEKIENPNCPVADVSRLISIEIAKATRDMARLIGPVADPTMAWKFKPYAEHIKALRELSKQLSETEVLSRKDMLNIDGPKCQFLLREIAKLYKKALKEAGCEISLIENAIRHFADLVSVDQERIRRELDKIESSRE
jgi:hypothetical protein